MTNSGAVAAVVTIVGLVFSELGITGVDSSVLSTAVNGLFSLATIGAALWSWRKHQNPTE